jgi:hypothetical protein
MGPTHSVNALFEAKLAVLALREGGGRGASVLVASALSTFEW